jgi:hypothetical protein
MNLKLKRIAPLQAGKLLAAFYGLLSLLIVPFMFAAMGIASLAARHGGGSAPAFPLMFGLGMGFLIFVPVLYAVMGFVFGVISAFIYNLLARWIGGFELEFEPAIPPPAPV